MSLLTALGHSGACSTSLLTVDMPFLPWSAFQYLKAKVEASRKEAAEHFHQIPTSSLFGLTSLGAPLGLQDHIVVLPYVYKYCLITNSSYDA